MNKSIEMQIRLIYNLVFAKLYSKKNVSELSKGSRVSVIRTAQMLEGSKKYEEFAKKFAIELAKKGLRGQKGVWRKFFNAAQKLHYIALPKTWTAFEAQILNQAIQHNFTMIKSIPQYVLNIMSHKYTSALIEEVAKGNLNRGSFYHQLQSHGHKNAKLIARTETAKLQTAILENRATGLGSVAYIWLASNDKRTRQSHKDMNGVVVFWRQNQLQKPHLDNMYGNAGEFPNCRCAPQPIFDELDLTKSSYKVYNYNNEQIITMTKSELLKAIKEGQLS